MRILFYGKLADLLGRELELQAEGACSVAELRELIAANHPQAEHVRNRRVRACIGDSLVTENHVVGPGDAVEFFPPVSGG